MNNVKHCPNCGCELDIDNEFCSECGYDLRNNVSLEQKDMPLGFFDNLTQKTCFPIIVYSFIVFGIFLFVGSIIWSSIMANGSIDFLTYIILTVTFSVFLAGIFLGYFGCNDQSYVLPNFLVHMGCVYSVVLCVIGLIFTFLMGIFGMLSSIFPSGGSNPAYPGASQSIASNYVPSFDLSGYLKIFILILVIPVASYLGIYLGYFLKENI